MSLSSLLKAGEGPVWDWFTTNFPETRRVGTDANRELRGGPGKLPCVVPPPAGTDHATVGTTVGYLLSAYLRADALEATVATNGAMLLRGALGASVRDPRDIERHVVVRATALAPATRALGGDEFEEMCGLCLILARLEQYYRAGPSVLPFLEEPLTDHGGDLSALAAAFGSEATHADIDALGRATLEDHLGLRDADTLLLGPTLAQSIALGGADADIIHDGMLVDLMSTSQASVVGRFELYQLLGYLLADTDDEYGITRVGFAALRRRRSHFWDAQEFVDELAKPGVFTLADKRAEFEALLARWPRTARTRCASD